MRIALFDDSIPFDGYTPAVAPLGGAEKSFASLASALARRGHDVSVFNRCSFGRSIDGAVWHRWDEERPSETDVLIAFRRPSLLGQIAARRKILWLTQTPEILETASAKAALAEHKPHLAFVAQVQARQWSGLGSLTAAVIPPGVRYDYLTDAANDPKPRAIVTTHPAHGLADILRLWIARIHPQVPQAELLVFSNALSRALGVGSGPPELREVVELAAQARKCGLIVQPPGGDAAMAQAYRAARVHFYPGQEQDFGCFTLAESQACGLPALARPLGAVRERLRDGETGYVVPDDDAFVNLAVHMLGDEDIFWSMNREARSQGERNWDHAAAEIEALMQ